MPAAHRALILAGLLVLGVAGARLGGAGATAPARWPTADHVFSVSGWAVGVPAVEQKPGVVFVSRRYSASAGATGAVLSVAVSAEAKRVYRAGADVPFAGSGYLIEPAPAGLFPQRSGWSTILATREGGTILIIAAHGERRGLLGTGAVAWAAAAVDGVIGIPNAYFQATLVVPLAGRDDTATAGAAADLADRVFAQLATWDAE